VGWHHIAGVRRGGSTALYVDGILAARGVGLVPDGGGEDIDAPLLIGGGSRAGFEGELARVRVWDRALAEGAIREAAGLQ
jgi:hypothetical protein